MHHNLKWYFSIIFWFTGFCLGRNLRAGFTVILLAEVKTAQKGATVGLLYLQLCFPKSRSADATEGIQPAVSWLSCFTQGTTKFCSHSALSTAKPPRDRKSSFYMELHSGIHRQNWAPGLRDTCLGLQKPLCFPLRPQQSLCHWKDIHRDQSLAA